MANEAEGKAADPGAATGAGKEKAVEKVVEPPRDASLDKVREILFGEQARSLEKKLEGLNARLGADFSAYREEVAKRLDGVEAKVRQEVEGVWKRLDAERRERGESLRESGDSLREQILGERRERAEALERIAMKVDEALESLGSRVAPLEKRVAREEQRTEQLISGQDKTDEAVRDLRIMKMDRSAFASLLTEITQGLPDAGRKSGA